MSIKKTKLNPSHQEIADAITDRVIEGLGKTRPVRKIRSSHILSAIIGATGLALFLVGVEKIFAIFSGWVSLALGLGLLIVSGTLFRKL